MDRCRFLAEMWVRLLELLYLAVGAPAEIAVPGVPQIGVADRLEATRRVEPRREFVCDALILDETVLARQPNGLFVKALGVELSALDASDLGADQRGPVPEILGAAFRPCRELLVVGGERLQVLEPLFRRCHIVPPRPR